MKGYYLHIKETDQRYISAGISALARVSGISRNTIVNWFSNHNNLYESKKYTCYKGTLAKNSPRGRSIETMKY